MQMISTVCRPYRLDRVSRPTLKPPARPSPTQSQPEAPYCQPFFSCACNPVERQHYVL
ncbi:hypothetical protein BGZ63DRAFT_382787 [Mariannaea sp. PMI_226]|nr:hypothetical protein BGZ63DRAFT_382787 [Mariannaea sp. PMI_226]